MNDENADKYTQDLEKIAKRHEELYALYLDLRDRSTSASILAIAWLVAAFLLKVDVSNLDVLSSAESQLGFLSPAGLSLILQIFFTLVSILLSFQYSRRAIRYGRAVEENYFRLANVRPVEQIEERTDTPFNGSDDFPVSSSFRSHVLQTTIATAIVIGSLSLLLNQFLIILHVASLYMAT